LIKWHVRRACEWTYLYAALDSTNRDSFCLYLSGMDGLCLEAFLEHLGEAYADHHLLVALDGLRATLPDGSRCWKT
jgi:hypothetical protein